MWPESASLLYFPMREESDSGLAHCGGREGIKNVGRVGKRGVEDMLRISTAFIVHPSALHPPARHILKEEEERQHGHQRDRVLPVTASRMSSRRSSMPAFSGGGQTRGTLRSRLSLELQKGEGSGTSSSAHRNWAPGD